MFRKLAVDASRSRQLGDVIIAQPPSLKFCILFIFLVSGTLLTIFFFGSYTQRATVVGRLFPQGGIAKVSSSLSGIIIKKNVVDGQAVRAGETLYVISGERLDGEGNATQTQVIESIATRQKHIKQSLLALEQSQDLELRQWQQKVVNLSHDIERYRSLLAEHRNLVQLAHARVNRYQKLKALRAVSTDEADQVQADFHEKRAHLYKLEGDVLIANRAKVEAEGTLATMPHKHRLEQSRWQSEYDELSQELAEGESARERSVVAPMNGIATTVVAHVGQYVISGRPLVSIVPDGQHLEAHLYVHSQAVGHLKPDLDVKLYYHAFPYQEYGIYHGRILSVSEDSAQQAEIAGLEIDHNRTGELLYLVKVELDKQTLSNKQGQMHRLRSGMLLEANIAKEKRHLYEWAFAPLYRVKDKM